MCGDGPLPFPLSEFGARGAETLASGLPARPFSNTGLPARLEPPARGLLARTADGVPVLLADRFPLLCGLVARIATKAAPETPGLFPRDEFPDAVFRTLFVGWLMRGLGVERGVG